VDEAGRGPLAGPVVASAIILHDFRFKIPLDDSKQMTPLAREQAYRAILRRASIGIGAAGAEEIDRIGILQATHPAMVRALVKLPLTPGLVLVDGNRLPRECPFPMQAIVRGDGKSLSIACASIVAKVVRDQWMELVHHLHPEYGFHRHKGYGTERHFRLLEEVGPCRFHRFSFRPIRKADGVRHRGA
jgi:ribonuclease HII